MLLCVLARDMLNGPDWCSILQRLKDDRDRPYSVGTDRAEVYLTRCPSQTSEPQRNF